MCKRHLKPGVSVILDNGIREGGVHYNRGIIKSRDGEYYMILINNRGSVYEAENPNGVLVERYLCEIRTE